MFNQYFRLPELISIDPEQSSSHFLLNLTDDVSDFVLMQALRAPLIELVVTRTDTGAEFLLRLQPGFSLFSHPVLNGDVQGQSAIAGDKGQGAIAGQVTSGHAPEHLLRGQGQGLRVYANSTRAPARLLERLRRGLLITLAPEQSESGLLGIRLDGEGEFNLVALETDLRLCEEPLILQNAKSVLAREPDYGASSAALALLITELEQARLELVAYLSGIDCHPGLAAEAMCIEPMLSQRRQWLLRQYAESQERPKIGTSANDYGQNIDKLKRLLECYELLSTPEVNAMVLAIAEED
ncbi:hypothetical protein [Shewanella sp. FJAT-52076]|uniref:hypothetical protein n=1 Tax=Shewanella sp. FJAT-52076 TaxID=2864202 RepID=UPI001C655841|nr:hypothetical protein [Shewanella sp. FJAT-52076]QYJ73778.1 hypothetical protein K0H79_10210 [Shewanella sp. FJAT-52076]